MIDINFKADCFWRRRRHCCQSQPVIYCWERVAHERSGIIIRVEGVGAIGARNNTCAVCVSVLYSAVAVVDITVIAFVVANTGVDVAATAVVVVVVGLVVGEFDKLTDHFVELGELVHGETWCWGIEKACVAVAVAVVDVVCCHNRLLLRYWMGEGVGQRV